MASATRLILGLVVALAMTRSAAAISFPTLGKRRAPPAPAEARELPPPAAKRAPGEWPQAHSDLAPDPVIRFGALANGMRYAILHSATPPGAASVRLGIAAGSLEEADDEAGVAHFVEHMAFEGSKGVPSGEMVKILERHGLSFGADTNAAADFGATTFKLDVAKADDETLDTALMLLRESAGELTFPDDAVTRQRAVILAEARDRDTPAWRVFEARLSFILDGQRPPLRFPIGRSEIIGAVTRDGLAAYYARWYRPERATLLVVGDVDPTALEAKIRARFGTWNATGLAGVEPALGSVAARGQTIRLFVEPGAPTSIEFAWAAPPDLSADTRSRRRRELVDHLGLAVVNRRLSSLAGGDSPPYLSAGAFRDVALGAARITGLIAQAEPGAWERALAAVDEEERRAVAYGVRPDELAAAVAAMRVELTKAAGEAATRPAAAVADEMTASLADDAVQTSAAQELAFFDEVAKTLKAEEVSAALKVAFQGAGPLVFVSSPVTVEGGEATVRAAFLASRARAVDAPALTAPAAWPYEDFGNPAKVASQTEVADLDTVFITFANGVRLTVKPTRFRSDEVLVKVRSGPGLRGLPADRQSGAWAAPLLIDGGWGRISRADADRALAPRAFGAQARIEDDAFSLSGTTRRDDLETQLQVLAAYVSDPGWRPEAFTAASLDRFAGASGGVEERDLPGLLHAGDRRWTQPTRADIAAASPEQLKAQITAMAAGPLEVLVVGDVTVEKAIDAVQRTFGALPARPATPAPAPGAVGFPAANARPLVVMGARPGQAWALVAWRTDDFLSDPQGARTATLLADVLGSRLSGARVAAVSSLAWPHWGYLSARADIAPGRLDAFFADVARISADLRDHDIAAEDLERVRKARLETLARDRGTNAWWLDSLSGAQTDPRRLAAIRSEAGGYERITAADLRRAAQKWLRDDAAWKLEVKPEVGGAQ